MTIFWGLAGVCQPPSTFWPVTLQPVVADQATIWHMKGDILSFHMRYRRLISIHRLQRKMNFCPLSFFSLVVSLPFPGGVLLTDLVCLPKCHFSCQLPTCVTRKCNLVCFMFWCQIESRPTNRWKWLVAATGAMYPCAKKFWGSKKKPPPTAWVIHCLRNFLPASRTQRDNARMTSAKLRVFG